MNDTSILMILGFIGSLIAIISPIIKLNSTITKLDITIKNINLQQDKIIKKVCEHDDKFNNHELRIDRLEREK